MRFISLNSSREEYHPELGSFHALLSSHSRQGPCTLPRHVLLAYRPAYAHQNGRHLESLPCAETTKAEATCAGRSPCIFHALQQCKRFGQPPLLVAGSRFLMQTNRCLGEGSIFPSIPVTDNNPGTAEPGG